MSLNDSFYEGMYRLPIEIGNKIFNYLMPSFGDHKKRMKLICAELKYDHTRDHHLETIFDFKVGSWVKDK